MKKVSFRFMTTAIAVPFGAVFILLNKNRQMNIFFFLNALKSAKMRHIHDAI